MEVCLWVIGNLTFVNPISTETEKLLGDETDSENRILKFTTKQNKADTKQAKHTKNACMLLIFYY